VLKQFREIDYGEAHPVAKGEQPEDGFTMFVHPYFMTHLPEVPWLVLYQLVLVNYGEFASGEDAAKALLAKQVDLFISDSTLTWYLAGVHANEGLAAAPIVLSQEQVAWGIRKGDEKLLAAADDFEEHSGDGLCHGPSLPAGWRGPTRARRSIAHHGAATALIERGQRSGAARL